MADLYPVAFLSIIPLARGGVFECEVSHSDAGEDGSKWILKIPGFSWLVENVVVDDHLSVQLLAPGPGLSGYPLMDERRFEPEISGRGGRHGFHSAKARALKSRIAFLETR